MVKTYINKSDVCNLSRIPVSINDNPIYNGAKLYLQTQSAEKLQKYLKEFKKSHNYKNLSDLLKVNSEFLETIKFNTFYLPWFHSRNRNIKDMAFFEFDEREKAKKIIDLVTSIQKNGYDTNKFPTRQNGVSGYFLTNHLNKKFYVVSGNHRIAVYFALFENLRIEVYISHKDHFIKGEKFDNSIFSDDGYMKDIDIKNIGMWPSVSKNFISKNDARLVLDAYTGG